MKLIADISVYNAPVDFGVVKEKLGGVICRAAYGRQEDDSFAEYAASAKKADVPFGAYLFATWQYNNVASDEAAAEAEAMAQADSLIGILKGKGVTGPVALDIEPEEGSAIALSPAAMTRIANAFLDKLAAAGYRPMLYASISQIYSLFLPAQIAYPFWVAYYNDAGDQSDAFPSGNWGDKMRELGDRIRLWQYTSTAAGKAYGVGSADLDLNHLYGDFTAESESTPVPKPEPTPSGGTRYTVVKNDTLSGIAARFGSTVAAILAANKVAYPSMTADYIQAGWTLTIPSSSEATPSEGTGYTVVKNDTLSSIAARFGTTVAAILAANQAAYPSMTADYIQTGWTLTIPSGGESAPTEQRYTVVKNDTLSGIAARFGTTVAAILAANKAAYPSITANYIQAGWTLTIPR